MQQSECFEKQAIGHCWRTLCVVGGERGGGGGGGGGVLLSLAG